VLRGLLNIAVFGAALAGVCSVIHRAQPFPPVIGVGEKWEHLTRHKDDYDVLFIGSSRVLQHIVPRQFDAALGGRVRSFNFGVRAMWPPESFWLARRILALRPARLRWVFIDLMNIPPHIDDNVMGRRGAYWHDWRHTLISLRAVAETPAPLRRKWALWNEHLGYLTREWTNQGRGAEWIAARLGIGKKAKPAKRAPEWIASEGYLPETQSTMLTSARLEAFQRDVAEQRRNFSRAPVSPALRRAVATLAAEARAAGVQPIFLVTPTIDQREHFGDFDAGVAVWRFDDPNEFPKLYDPALRFDTAHFNEAGARAFTELLAERFGDALK